jgi:hypothetical protein
MNARRKLRLRAKQRWQKKRQRQFDERSEQRPAICKGCAKPFMPEWSFPLGRWQTHCPLCAVNNLFRMLEMWA